MLATNNPTRVETFIIRDPKCDDCFKILFRNVEKKERLLNLLNSLLHLEGDEMISDFEYLDPDHNSIVERSIYFDLKCVTSNGEHVVIEIQKVHSVHHAKRWIYYAAKALTNMGEINYTNIQNLSSNERKTEGSKFYDKLNPVKVICFLNFNDPKLTQELVDITGAEVDWNIMEVTSRIKAHNLLSWKFIILPLFTKSLKEIDSDLDAWLYLLTRSDRERVSLNQHFMDSYPIVTDCFKTLSHLSHEEINRINNELELEDFTLGAIYNGRLEGREEGRVEGREERRKEGKFEAVSNYLKSFDEGSNMTENEFVAKMFKISVENVKELKRKISLIS